MAPKTFMFRICFALTTAHTAEHSYGRQPEIEVAKVKGLSPRGLVHESMPPYRSHLYKNSQKFVKNRNIIQRRMQSRRRLVIMGCV